MNIEFLVRSATRACVGFLTLTFSEPTTDVRAAQARLNSLLSHALRERYPNYIRVLERDGRGAIHYHMLVVVPHDIRSGINFDEIKQRRYRSAPPALRAEWIFLREVAPRYGFGRVELLPIRTTGEAVGYYLSKYLREARRPCDKGVRLVSYGGTAKVATEQFSWVGDRGTQWRAAVRLFAALMYAAGKIPSPTPEALTAGLGPRWAKLWHPQIVAFMTPANVGYWPMPDAS